MGTFVHYYNVDVIDRSYRNATTMNRSNRCYEMNQKITDRLSSTSFINKRCFIIAGGESLQEFDYGRLSNDLCIGINKVFQYFQDATINYSMDQDFYDRVKDGRLSKYSNIDVLQKWNDFRGIRVFLCPLTVKQFDKDVYLVKRTHSDIISRDLGYGIYPGRNSAVGALMLAIALGANPIYLLGYDMHAKTKSHWHDGYPDRDLVEFNHKLDDYRKEFDALAPMIADSGIAVYNLNKSSSLKCFDFSDIDAVLNSNSSS
jgi:hypothetical protein